VETLGYTVANTNYFCFELQSGDIVWYANTNGSVFEEVALLKGMIYGFHTGGSLQIRDAMSGKLVIEIPPNLNNLDQSPYRLGRVGSDRIFILGTKYIYAYEAIDAK
jgi:hypothetical protein